MDAFNLGLVDKLGGLETALELAAEKVGLERSEIVPVPYPPRQTPFAQLSEALSGKGPGGLEALLECMGMSSSLNSCGSGTFTSTLAKVMAADRELATIMSAQGVQMLSLDALYAQKGISEGM